MQIKQTFLKDVNVIDVDGVHNSIWKAECEISGEVGYGVTPEKAIIGLFMEFAHMAQCDYDIDWDTLYGLKTTYDQRPKTRYQASTLEWITSDSLIYGFGFSPEESWIEYLSECRCDYWFRTTGRFPPRSK